MKFFNLTKHALTFTIGAAMLVACNNNGGASVAPPGASSGLPGIAHIGRAVMVNGVPITAAHPNLSAHAVRSQPTKRKGRGPFQYISNFGASNLAVFDYPKSEKQIGSLSLPVPAAQGFCTNVLFGTGKKTFWVASSSSSAGALYEFKVGGKGPIKTLTTPSGDYPTGCAINPTTGDLAVPDLLHGHLDIFKGAKGTATQYSTPLVEAFFAGFDNKSNLYVDGFNSGGTFGFVELPKGSKSLKTLSGASVEFPGAVQFDGKYITVNDQEAHDIFGYKCSGTNCRLKQTVALTGASDCDQTWIAKGYVICPDAGNNDAEIFKYPAGGSAEATLTGSLDVPLSAIQVEK